MTDSQGIPAGTSVPRIVVGVDSSASSVAALRWAVGQARLTGLPLLVVHAWKFVPYPYLDPLLVRATAEQAAREVLDDAVRAGVGDDPDVEVHTRLVCGHPARVLADLGRLSTMVVIGGGGHGELAGLLLGSVGLHLAAHAPVPVVIVPRSAVGPDGEGLRPADQELSPV